MSRAVPTLSSCQWVSLAPSPPPLPTPPPPLPPHPPHALVCNVNSSKQSRLHVSHFFEVLSRNFHRRCAMIPGTKIQLGKYCLRMSIEKSPVLTIFGHFCGFPSVSISRKRLNTPSKKKVEIFYIKEKHLSWTLQRTLSCHFGVLIKIRATSTSKYG